MWDQLRTPPREKDVAAVVELASRAEPRCGSTVVVAIDGPSGAGKTTLASGVADSLRSLGSVDVVHMDLLFPGWDGLAEAPGLVTTQVLKPLSLGLPAAYRLWSWTRDEWRGSREVAPSRFLVVEGCGSSAAPAAAYAAVRVFVEADRGIRKRRGIERDGEAYRPRWEGWAAQERSLYEADRTRERADLLIDTSSL
jgi:uridine kinase